MARVKAKNGERAIYVGCKLSKERVAKLQDMAKYGGQSMYQIACKAMEDYIDMQDVPGYPQVAIPDNCIDCDLESVNDEPCHELYCPDLGEEVEHEKNN